MTIKLSEMSPIVIPFLEDFSKSSHSLDQTRALFDKNLKRINQLYLTLNFGLDEDRLQYISSAEKNKGNSASAEAAAKAAAKARKHSDGMGAKLQSPEDRETIVSDLKKNIRLLIEMYNVCVLSIAAKQHYYDHTWAGKIAQALQSIGQKLGFQTPLQKAESTLNRCVDALERQGRSLHFSRHQPLFAQLDSEEFINEANVISVIGIARACATLQKQNFYAALKEFPNHTLIAKKNGDVIMIDKSMTGGKGAEKYVYKNNLGLLPSSISELLAP
jgi:hypothetical protein